MLAYGDALEKAGLSDNKFRDKYGREAIKPKKSGSGGGQGRTSFNLYSGSDSGNPLTISKQLRKLLQEARLG
jgi:hypothetical protein